jgi:signal transduction histidine kinase
MRFRERWLRLRLRTRIAGTIVLALVAVNALIAVIFILMPAQLLTIYSANWLTGKAEVAALLIFQENAQERDAIAARLEADNHVQISWQRTWDEPGPETRKSLRPFLERARATIESDLAGRIRKVAVKGVLELRGNLFRVDVQPQPPDFLDQLPLGPLAPEEPDLAILGIFELAVQGLDGSWVVIKPEGTKGYAERLKPLLVLLTGAVVMISLLSTVTARNTLRPLERLAESARQFGRTRKAAPVDPAGLYEFEVVAQAMNEMQGRIKRFIDERTQMLAALSHDLRSSLTGLLLDAEEVSGGESKNRLIAGIEDLERVISATLAFAGDDLKAEPAQKIDLAALLISLCDSFSDRNAPASYSGPNHIFAVCQPVAIKRAFTNLIDNAVKYGGCARVRLEFSANGAAISIADDGPGIPAEKAELAFRPFGRLDDARNRESGGVGLGLTIARDVIQSHGGEVSLGVRSEGKAFEVQISLPLSPKRVQRRLAAGDASS